jgi:hypothetical protein
VLDDEAQRAGLEPERLSAELEAAASELVERERA